MSRFVPATVNGRTVGTTKTTSTTSANFALSSLGVVARTIRVVNMGTAGVYYAISNTAPTVTGNDIYLPPGNTNLIDIPDEMIGTAYFGYLASTGTPTINITVGTERN